jgi:hypothetical protein
MPKHPKPAPTSNGLDLQAVAETGQRSLAAMARMHTRAFRDAMKFNAELLDFTRRRIGANIATSDKLAHCETVNEAVDVVTGFCQCAMEDYSEESTTLIRMSTEIAKQNGEETAAEVTG